MKRGDTWHTDCAWQSVETAPKDGTFVLIGMPSGHVTIAQFCQDQYWRSHVSQAPWEAFTPKWWARVPSVPREAA